MTTPEIEKFADEYLKIRNKQLEYALDQAEEEIFRWQQRCFQIEVEHEELKKQIMGILK